MVRYYFGQFGLGVPTGIGFPNVTSGMKSDEIRTYHQIAIGQLDTIYSVTISTIRINDRQWWLPE